MTVYYMVIGHLEDREEAKCWFDFNEEKSVYYLERKFEKKLFEAEGYDAEDVQDFKNSGKICYIDHILKSNQPILGF